MGESIAVDGCCLTVVDSSDNGFACELSPETLNLTTSARYGVGTIVNLERALRMGDAIGGHHVSGHVDEQAYLEAIELQGEFTLMRFSGFSNENLKYITKKGSIAINGVSLTINKKTPTGLEVMLIPHTLERTNLSRLKVGEAVNVEFDWMVRVLITRLESLQELGID